MSLPVVAVVNDDPTFLQLLEEIIKDSRRYDVKVLQKGMGAIDHLRRIDPDVIVMDIRLEYARLGYHLIEALRRDGRLRYRPIIVCTADSRFLRDYADRLDTLETDTLEKPFDLDDLLRKIDTAIQGTGRAM